MLWIKAFHIIFMVCWFAGLFYLPRILVNFAGSDSPESRRQLAGMAHRLYRFVTPFMLLTIFFGLWLLARDRSAWFSYMASRPGKIGAGALAAATAYGLVIYAMSVAPMGMVSSLRETSVIFAALIGSLLFREPFGRQRIIAAVLVCLGVALIKILS